MTTDLAAVFAEFDVPARFVEGGPHGNGHINDTYAVVAETADGCRRRYILQRMNHKVFTRIPELMENILRVTRHVRGKVESLPGHDPDREALTVIPSRGGGPFIQREDGSCWRCYIFIENALTTDVAADPRQAYEAAKAFGTFQEMLRDLPMPRLHDTIPDFHHTPKRFEKLRKAIEQDRVGRAESAGPEIAFALARGEMTTTVTDGIERGEIPERVTHNDTKINNVMLDIESGRGVCVIDLDTVMPGSVLYDFGDMVRTSTSTGAEDERDLSLVTFQRDFFDALVCGYLDAVGASLLPRELELLAFSGRLITFEIGIRFLTDYLEGDVYFKTHHPDHNLDRTRTQFALVRAMEEQADALDALVRSRCRERGIGI
ncbi:MAG: aminoglycoside phosphotransferase family protein [Kiritimatiellaeota bacterium]|nr:aminoglycoside phosphotransferase family protein [Kiritimatiellota bacterium]